MHVEHVLQMQEEQVQFPNFSYAAEFGAEEKVTGYAMSLAVDHQIHACYPSASCKNKCTRYKNVHVLFV
jgi:hypothetical protein